MNGHVLQNVALRIHRAYQYFFNRVKRGLVKPGFPRFKGRDRYDSFTYVESGWNLSEKNRIKLDKIGSMKIVRWKEIPPKGKIKQVIIKREGDQWFAILTVAGLSPNPLLSTGKIIGIDVGLRNLVTTSEGQVLGDLEDLKKKERWHRNLQRKLSRKTFGSGRRTKAKRELIRSSIKLTRTRKYQLDCISRKLVNENDFIAIEDLDIQKLSRQEKLHGQLGKNVRRTFAQAALGILTRQLISKAEEAGRKVVFVNPKNTSQRCSLCESIVPKKITDRVHSCPHCGFTLDRDHNAARNILHLALWANQETNPVGGKLNEEFALCKHT